MPTPLILIIDDDAEIRYSLERVLTSRDYRVATAASGELGIEQAADLAPAVIFLDNRMEGISGIETLQHLRSQSPQAMVILMTAFGTTQTAIEAMKFGAFDYIIKPFDIKKVLGLTEKAVAAHEDLRRARQNVRAPRLTLEDYREGIVGNSEPMREVFKIIGQVAASEVTVMITGESGTGKELVARCIAQHSHRSDRPFLAVNCAAIPENLIESELFGHERGAFTGATQQRAGKFEMADGGTLFLDEIGDMALPTQTKILRALQESEIQRVGGDASLKVDVRLLAATNKDIEKMVEAGDFREDLYYRLNVMRIKMPALRERREDIPELIDFMLQRLAQRRKSRVKQLSDDALKRLCSYPWPGNVRELENVIQRSAVVAQGDTVLLRDLPRELRHDPAPGEPVPVSAPAPSATPVREGDSGHPSAPVSAAVATPVPSGMLTTAPAPGEAAVFAPEAPASGAAGTQTLDLGATLDLLYERLRERYDKALLHELEREMIVRVLAETGGNQVKASALLGITRATLRKRINEFGLKL